MSHTADYHRLGMLPLRDHSTDASNVFTRTALYGGQILGRDKESGQYEYAGDRFGDVLNAGYWKPAAREVGAWSFAMPSVVGNGLGSLRVTTPSFGTDGASPAVVAARTPSGDSETSGPSPTFVAPPFSYAPAFAGYMADPAFATKTGRGPSSWPGFPKGWVGIGLAGSNIAAENFMFMPTDPRLVAVNRAGNPAMSTIVVDLDDSDRVDDTRAAPLHTMMRVIKRPKGKIEFGPRNPIAWNMSNANQDESTGWGMIYCELEKEARGGGSTTPSDSAPAPKAKVSTPSEPPPIDTRGGGGDAPTQDPGAASGNATGSGGGGGGAPGTTTAQSPSSGSIPPGYGWSDVTGGLVRLK